MGKPKGEKKETENIPDDFQGLSTVIGIDSTLKVMEYFQGSTVYFRKFGGSKLEKKSRLRAMQKRMTQLKELGIKNSTTIIAREFNLTDRRVRQIFQSDSSSKSW